MESSENTVAAPEVNLTRAERHSRHQDMLFEHKRVKQERQERMRKERFQGKPRKYPGHLY